MQFGTNGEEYAERGGEHDGEIEDEEMDESLALARRLQEEEQAEYRNRMLAMAGIDPSAMGEDDSENEGLDTDAMTYEELIELGDTVGKVVCGLTEAQMSALPTLVVDTTSGAAKDDKCAVCCMEFEHGEEGCCSLPRCGHVFHFECVEPWLRENKSCPTCKTEVFEETTTMR
jgi:E3 ubiquitin-protein ligase BIG BROTHER-like protein